MTPKILIVEDEMLVALELESILAESGFEPVGIAPDLTTAEEFFGETIDLALVDLNLRDGLTGPQIGKLLSEKASPSCSLPPTRASSATGLPARSA